MQQMQPQTLMMNRTLIVIQMQPQILMMSMIAGNQQRGINEVNENGVNYLGLNDNMGSHKSSNTYSHTANYFLKPIIFNLADIT